MSSDFFRDKQGNSLFDMTKANQDRTAAMALAQMQYPESRQLSPTIAEAVAVEREACSKIAEDQDSTIYDTLGHTEEYPTAIAAAIRARGKE